MSTLLIGKNICNISRVSDDLQINWMQAKEISCVSPWLRQNTLNIYEAKFKRHAMTYWREIYNKYGIFK